MNKVIAALKSAYGICAERVERITYGLWEESFSVWAGEKRYYVKRFYAKWRLQTRYQEMLDGLALSQQLHRDGFPAPLLISTLENEHLANVEGETYQVNEWVHGRSFHPGELPLREAKAMGRLLARFHRQFGSSDIPPERVALPSPPEARQTCEQLLVRYENEQGDFASHVRLLLEEQIRLLQSLPDDFASSLPEASLHGPCFHSYWVEQLIFQPDGQVAALVDWTDGAGRKGYWANDMVTGLHLSALDQAGALAFCAGYQEMNPLPAREWQVVLAKLCYGHLASTNFLASWLDKHNRRMDHWESIATEWTRLVPVRFQQWRVWERELLGQFFGKDL